MMTTTTEKPTVDVKIQDQEGCRKTLSITIPADQVEEQYNALLQGYRKAAKISGFRPGTAPMNLVKNRYKKEIQEELKEQLLPFGYQTALQESELDVVQVLDVTDLEVTVGEPISFDVDVDIAPTFELPEYKGLALKAESIEVTDEDVQHSMKELLDYYGTFEDADDRAIEEGDLVKLTFTSSIEGKKPSELDAEADSLDSREDFWVRAGDEAFLPDFGKQLIGLAVGDKKDITVTLDENFVAKEVAGKEILFEVEVHGVRVKVPPQMDDDLFEKLDVKSEEELLERMRTDLEQSRASREENRQRDALVKGLLDSVHMDLPQSEVSQETQNIIQDIVQRNTAKGISEDDIRSHKDEIFQSAEQNANGTVKLKYLLREIAAKEDITVNAEEMREYLMRMAATYRMEMDRLMEQLKKNEAMEQIRGDVLQRKVIDYIMGEANIS